VNKLGQTPELSPRDDWDQLDRLASEIVTRLLYFAAALDEGSKPRARAQLVAIRQALRVLERRADL
jgi:hypothetical protein